MSACDNYYFDEELGLDFNLEHVTKVASMYRTNSAIANALKMNYNTFIKYLYHYEEFVGTEKYDYGKRFAAAVTKGRYLYRMRKIDNS